MARSKFDEDAPLYSASTGSKSKVKKQTDLKPTAMKKVSAPKTDKAGGAKSSGSLPKLGMRKSKVGGRKR